MTFGYTILYVDDVDRSVSFYEDAFGLKCRFVHESGTYAEMDTGETTLAFAHHDLASENVGTDVRHTSAKDPPLGFEIALVTENVPSVPERHRYPSPPGSPGDRTWRTSGTTTASSWSFALPCPAPVATRFALHERRVPSRGHAARPPKWTQSDGEAPLRH